MAHAATLPTDRRLDSNRILAGSGALALNAALLVALMAPVAVPVLEQAHRDSPLVVFPMPAPRVKPPIAVPVTQEQPRKTAPVARTSPQTQPQTVNREAMLSDEPGEPLDPPVEAAEPGETGAQTIAPPAEASAGARLQYLDAPAPPYPRDAMREGLTGTVMLEVLVDIDGRPLSVRVARSSGHRVLDQAARRQVLGRWRFQPALQDGQPVQAIGLVPVEFNLDR